MSRKPPEGIRALLEMPTGGHVLMTAFPGQHRDAEGAIRVDEVGQVAVLEYMVACGVRRLVALAEGRDLPNGAMDDLQVRARASGITLDQRPIVDFGVPDAAFMDRWSRDSANRASAFARGETIAVCCRHGAGRSGLIAVLLLMESGVALSEALSAVRGGFAEAVETEAQEAWLRLQETMI